jgi:D-2-hydroxyacid dehydrogenase (NADP+)
MTINNIIITGRLYKDMELAIGQLEHKNIRYLAEEEVTEEALKCADAYVAFRPTRNFKFYNLKWVHSLGAGVDGYLLNRQWKEGVLLTRTICSFGRKISEYCLSYMLAELQFHNAFRTQKKHRSWQVLEPLTLESQRVLILGTGVIGQEVAKSLNNFGVRPVGVSQSGAQKEYFYNVFKLDEIRNILPEVNWIINTLPLTKATENILNIDIFSLMRNASLINVGRGGALEERALIAALNNRNIKAAYLDVFKEEPLPVNSELWNNPKIHITPHISAITTVEEAVKCFLDTMNSIEQGNYNLENKVELSRGY